jgi:hypothetical protein
VLEALLAKAPGQEAYAAAWDVLTDEAERFGENDRAAARKVLLCSAEVAERLSDDNAANLFKPVISYERLGDLELAEKRLESAADWYVKGFDAARRRVALKSDGGGAEPVCVSPPIDQQELGGSA